MFKGFYNLTSGMLSQGRRLDVVANNMTNVSTAGYRSDSYTDSTFMEVVMSRVGNRVKGDGVEVGNASYILAPDRIYTNFEQSSFDETGLPLDFAIDGDGFFAIRSQDGATRYTRAGNFTLDNEGYLSLNGQGRVLNDQGEEILLLTDKITADARGGLYLEDGNGYLGRVGVYAFADNGQLTRDNEGLFLGDGAQAVDVTVHNKMLERSNADLARQMSEMMYTQRALQSAAQLSKMYDQVMTKATTEVGRL